MHDVGVLYERHMAAVLAIARRYLRDEADAQDAVMQLFEQLVEKLRRHEVENFPPWLAATARNHCLMVLRARQRAGPAGGALVHFSDAAGMESVAARHLPPTTLPTPSCTNSTSSGSNKPSPNYPPVSAAAGARPMAEMAWRFASTH